MINVLGLNQEDKDVVRESFDLLQKKYQCTLENEMAEAMTNRFSTTRLIGEYSTVNIKNVFKIINGDKEFYILTIYLANFRERLAPRMMIFGLSHIDRDFGPVFIRPETLWDKIGDLFNKKDVDFEEHKGFSNKYCLFAENRELVKQSISKQLLDEIFKLDKVSLEFYDKNILATFKRRINVEDTMALADFMSRIKLMGY